MTAKPRLREVSTGVWKPVVNVLGQPIACDVELPGCCGECLAWLHCILQSPLKVELAGFNFEDWLQWTRMSSAAWLQSENGDPHFTIGPSGETYTAFTGTFVHEPLFSDKVTAECESAADFDANTHCENPESLGSNTFASVLANALVDIGSPLHNGGPGVFESQHRATHISREGRTLYAQNACYGTHKKFYLSTRVQCTEEESVVGLRFYLILSWEFETGPPAACYLYESGEEGTNPLDGCDLFDGQTLCGEDRCEDGFGGAIRWCHAIMGSDHIPLAGLEWADLQNIQLSPTQWIAPYVEDASVGISDPIRTHSLFANEIEVWACNDPDPPSLVGSDEILDECHADSIGTIDAEGTSSGTVLPTFCLPPPIIPLSASSADYKISVMLPNCTVPGDCRTCDQDGEPGGEQEVVAVDFSMSAGCHKEFTAIYPECITPTLIIFQGGSFGYVGNPGYGVIANLDEASATFAEEQVTMYLLDDRGCLYCVTKTATCGCCEGVTGTLTATEVNSCSYELEADITGTVTCTQPVILWWLASWICPPLESDCECVDGVFDCDCVSSLGDGQTTIVDVSGSDKLYWAILDSPCGCLGPRNEIDLSCTVCSCCDGLFDGIQMTLANISTKSGNGDPWDSCDCASWNGAYQVPRGSDGYGDCGGGLLAEDLVHCGGVGFDIYLLWNIYCELNEEDEMEYWLTLQYITFFGHGGPAGGGVGEAGPSTDILLSTGTPPTCLDISGSVSLTASPLIAACVYSTVTVGYDAY